MESIHAEDRRSDVDPLIALMVDVTRSAIRDYLRGPHGSAKRAKDFYTAKCFLVKTGLITVVEEHYGLKQADDVEALIDELA